MHIIVGLLACYGTLPLPFPRISLWHRVSKPQATWTAFLPRVSRTKRKLKSGYFTPAVSGAQKWAEWLHHPCLLGGPQKREQKSETTTETLPSQGPTCGRNGYITTAFLGVRNTGTEKWGRGGRTGGNRGEICLPRGRCLQFPLRYVRVHLLCRAPSPDILPTAHSPCPPPHSLCAGPGGEAQRRSPPPNPDYSKTPRALSPSVPNGQRKGGGGQARKREGRRASGQRWAGNADCGETVCGAGLGCPTGLRQTSPASPAAPMQVDMHQVTSQVTGHAGLLQPLPGAATTGPCCCGSVPLGRQRPDSTARKSCRAFGLTSAQVCDGTACCARPPPPPVVPVAVP